MPKPPGRENLYLILPGSGRRQSQINHPGSFGVLVCGSAIGVSIQANRFKGVRAAIVTSLETAKLARAHNDANVLCLSADALAEAKDPLESEKHLEDTLALVDAFLNTPFSNEPRHLRRIKRLDKEPS